MAIANLSPPDRRRAEQQASRILRMQSPDPVTRWQAREEQIAEAAGSFNYEFLCGISRRVPRHYVKGGKTVQTIHYLLDT